MASYRNITLIIEFCHVIKQHLAVLNESIWEWWLHLPELKD